MPLAGGLIDLLEMLRPPKISKLQWPSPAASRTALLVALLATKLRVPAERARRPRATEEGTNSSENPISIQHQLEVSIVMGLAQ